MKDSVRQKASELVMYGSSSGLAQETHKDKADEEVSDKEENVKVKMIKAPKAPTAREVEEHMLTHVPFRSWRPHCVAGQASAHARRCKPVVDNENGVPMVSMDYMFMTSKHKGNKDEVKDEDCADQDEKGLPILVISDHETGMTFASVVQKKGAHPYSVLRVCNDLALLAHPKLILKTDGEPAIQALKEAVQAESGLKIEVDKRQ